MSSSSVSTDLAHRISDARFVLGAQTPFLGSLLLSCSIQSRPSTPTASTDGEAIYVNEDFVSELTFQEFLGLLVHELLHAALLHVQRREARDPWLWNVAADMVINEIIDEQGLVLPPGPVKIPPDKPEWQGRSVEEIYELLHSEKEDPKEKDIDLSGPWRDLTGQAPQGEKSQEKQNAIAHKWRQALRRAREAQRLSSHGSVPAGFEKYVDRVLDPQVDWRRALWKFLVRTPVDFQRFDRRLMHRGLYVKTLEAESVELYVAIDTSGSISEDHLAMFIAELRGILQSYPHVRVHLYYADADLYGPYELSELDGSEVPTPVGGGGTSFLPFFEAVAEEVSMTATPVLVYLTDGYGEFPEDCPFPVLWVTVPGSLEPEEFPFGQVIQLRPTE